MEHLITGVVDHSPSIIVFILGGLGFVWAIRRDVAVIGTKLEEIGVRTTSLEVELKKMTEVLVAIGRQEERMLAQAARMSSIDTAVADLRREMADLRRDKEKAA